MTRSYTHNGLAGCVSQRRAQETGRVVGVYHNTQAGLDDEYPWSTVCEDHGHIVSHPTLELARAHAAAPLGWCEACMGDRRFRDDFRLAMAYWCFFAVLTFASWSTPTGWPPQHVLWPVRRTRRSTTPQRPIGRR